MLQSPSRFAKVKCWLTMGTAEPGTRARHAEQTTLMSFLWYLLTRNSICNLLFIKWHQSIATSARVQPQMCLCIKSESLRCKCEKQRGGGRVCRSRWFLWCRHGRQRRLRPWPRARRTDGEPAPRSIAPSSTILGPAVKWCARGRRCARGEWVQWECARQARRAPAPAPAQTNTNRSTYRHVDSSAPVPGAGHPRRRGHLHP